MQVKLPRRKIFKTPRLLIADSYTISSDLFASPKCKEKSIYYLTFRGILNDVNPDLYNEGDNRIIFSGLSRILDYLFYEPVTHAEIDETKRFLEHARATKNGYQNMYFPEALWRLIVDKYNGRPPIKITGLPEGSVVYPNEPVLMVESMDEEFEMGEIAAWFESTFIKVWSSTQMVTQLMHWLEYWKGLVRYVYGNTISEEQITFLASLCLHNFGCRAGMVPQESEWMGADALYVFPGTDTFSGAYQAWKNADEQSGFFGSVYALAHRNVQGWDKEEDAYKALFNVSKAGDFDSMVADCYNYFDGTEQHILPLAKKSHEEKLDITVVDRPDSGDAKEQVLWMCKLAHKHGLSIVEQILKREWRFPTTMKFIEGDSMTFKKMKEINEDLLLHGFPPFAWGLYGVGGGLRKIFRDDYSTKFALCAMGKAKEPVCKFSETLGKTTLPGPFKVLRSKEALESKKTVVFPHEPGEDASVTYFDGSDIWDPYKEGYEPSFMVIKNRMHEQFSKMPKSLTTEENHNYPASDEVKAVRIQLLKKYSPKKLAQNYS